MAPSPESLVAPVKAVLGPTNTGKTHLAVERMCAHSSGMIGFPLRLLAREVYDRVVRLKGADSVALMTGEERIMPPQARYILGTMEALPVAREMGFVGIDEAQLGTDGERGHVFTDRILRARGRDETMILGSDALRGVLPRLVPGVDMVTRPRFSTLSYGGHAKLSRLPRRSAIVAFSVEEVYAIAEMLRRFAGGAAVVLGALSPRTRNAQVAMFQAGEVDYLVATDAIGMGLNLDVTHVAFASLQKFDGRRVRRLTTAEMAQIAGRAGRHQQDGSFGTIGLPQGGFTPEEIAAIEGHHFPPIAHLYWREANPRTGTLAELLADLAAPPAHEALRAAPESIDLAVLRHLAGDPVVAARADDGHAVARLWDACGLPDFEQLGAEHHSRLVKRLWAWRTTGTGQVDPDWFEGRLRRLDDPAGDVDQLSARIAAVRTLCFIAERGDWLADAPGWAARAQMLEQRLSDALHAALAQRFVDRRLALLMRDTRQRGNLPVAVGGDGTVTVDGEAIGTLAGFRFRVDPAASAVDHRMLLAAAERHLASELTRRAAALAEAPDADLSLVSEPGDAPALAWRGHVVARLARGNGLTQPALLRDAALRAIDPAQWNAIAERLARYVSDMLARHAAPMVAMAQAAGDLFTPAPLRAVLAELLEQAGIAARAAVDPALRQLSAEDRGALRRMGVTIGSLDLYHPALLKPEAVRWRAALIAARRGTALPLLPPPGAVRTGAGAADGLELAGFRRVGDAALRIDMIERLARQAHAARLQAAAPPVAVGTPLAADAAQAEIADAVSGAPVADTESPPGFVIDPALATSLGLDAAAHRGVLAALGFRSCGEAADGRWRWRGLKAEGRTPRKRKKARRAEPAREAGSGTAKTSARPAKPPHRDAKPAKVPFPPRPPAPSRRGRSAAVHSPFAGLADLLAKGRPQP